MGSKVFVLRDNKEVELKGAELEAFNEDRARMHAEFMAFQEQQAEREAKLESALNKLKSLGLTESEAKIIIGLE